MVRRASERRGAVTEYAEHRLTREREESGRGYVARVARKTGFSPAHVSNVANGRAPLGEDFELALSKLWNFPSVTALRQEAQKWVAAAATAATEPAKEGEVQNVEIEPYPNRARARALAVAAGVSDAAIRRVQSLRLRASATDKPVRWWLARFLEAAEVSDVDLSQAD